MQKLKLMLASTMLAMAAAPTISSAQVTPKEVVEIATDAYVYGYSLLTTDVTRIQMSNVDKAEGLHSPRTVHQC